MKVFISWSGPKSRAAAEALRAWLPKVIQALEPFVSSHDISAGSRGENVIAAELAETDFGIVCITRANQTEPWINFEAGALAKRVGHGQVIPLALDLSLADIKRPLGQFQARTLDKSQIREVVNSLNDACAQPLVHEVLGPTFEKWWPELDEAFTELDVVEEPGDAPTERSDGDKIDEVLQAVRSLSAAASAVSEEEDPHEHLRDALREMMYAAGLDGIRMHWRADARDLIEIEANADIPPSLAKEMAARAARRGVGLVIHAATPQSSSQA
jgi:hypothetical protein